jgi:hypothetical protein
VANGPASFDADADDDGQRISLVNDEPLRAPVRAAPQLAMSGRVARSANVRAFPSEAPTLDTAIARMMPGLKLIGLGILIMLADVGYAVAQGEAFRVGPARALWLAGPLVGFGLVKLLLSLAR